MAKYVYVCIQAKNDHALLYSANGEQEVTYKQ